MNTVRHFPLRAVAALFCGLMSGAPSQAGISNGDFNADPIFGDGQTGLVAGDMKRISTDPADSEYAASISGIQYWNYPLPGWDGTLVGTWSDHGLAIPTGFSNGDGSMAAFINNWERTISQVSCYTVTPQTFVRAEFDFGTLGVDGAGLAGEFYVIAGTMDPADLDAFATDAVVVAKLTVANQFWTGAYAPDYRQDDGLWTHYYAEIYFPLECCLDGRPLTVAFRTLSGSTGPTYWDNVELYLEAVPEPGTLPLAALGLLMTVVLWRRRC